MPPVRLYLDHSDPSHLFRFRKPDGTRGQIPGLRLKVYVNLSHLVRPGRLALDASYPSAVLDTGAYLTIIPERIWSQFRPRAITILPFDVSMPQAQRDIVLAGGSFAYQLAEMPVRLQDLAGGIVDVTVTAHLTHDRGRLAIPMILGLRGGVLDGRVLRAEPDAAAPYGQAWILEEP